MIVRTGVTAAEPDSDERAVPIFSQATDGFGDRRGREGSQAGVRFLPRVFPASVRARASLVETALFRPVMKA
jgi:hypothetical protein